MYCPNCGKKQGENAKFCYSCGIKIIIPKDDDNEPSVSPSVSPMPSISSENSAQTKPIQPIKDTVPQKTEIRNDKAFEATKGNEKYKDGIEDRINKFKEREEEERRSIRAPEIPSNPVDNNNSKGGCLVAIIIGLIAIFIIIIAMGSGGSSSSKATCSVCGRYTTVGYSGMCDSCYRNYKQMQPYYNYATGN